MKFKPKDILISEINQNEYIEFNVRSSENEPIPLTTDEFENFVRSPEHSRGPRGQTSMRIDDNVLWKFELIKRSSKVFFNNELSTMPIIINALFDTFSKTQLKGSNPTPNPHLEKILKKLNKAFLYEGTMGEFSVTALTYHQCYIIRILYLLFIEEDLVTEFECDLLSFILQEERFNSRPKKIEKTSKFELKAGFVNADLNFQEIIYCFGTNSFIKDLNQLMNKKVDEINPDIPRDESDLPNIENKIFAQKYIEDKNEANKWLEKTLKIRKEVYRDSIIWKPDSRRFSLLQVLHLKIGTLKYKEITGGSGWT